LYRYHRLTSLNDVGGNPLRFGVSVPEFHCQMERRARSWPHTMSATSTHDSKRSEDVRARINVLSEIPGVWRERVVRLRELNSKYKQNGVPTANDEYLFYQTLVGTWPVRSTSRELEHNYIRRIRDYMLKAIREAKENTSWSSPNQAYESGANGFVNAVLTDQTFITEASSFRREILRFGMLNSLAQIVIKLTAPGVPDIYQGDELWRFDLVDPDNRQPVNYAARQSFLQEIRASEEFPNAQLKTYARKLLDHMEDGRIKIFTIWKTLGLRRSQPDLFTQGDYAALRADGPFAAHVIAYARAFSDSRLIVVAPRLCARLLETRGVLPCGDIWQDTTLHLPDISREFRNVFTGEILRSEESGGDSKLALASVLKDFPIALLVSQQ
jgi:(1->4)-alpha-D-glucan 1-alpha-D-glucosylmutase